MVLKIIDSLYKLCPLHCSVHPQNNFFEGFKQWGWPTAIFKLYQECLYKQDNKETNKEKRKSK
jgi:hypothetical protein